MRRIGAALVVVGLVLTGCATVPDDSAPSVLGTVATDRADSAVRAPVSGREPDLLVGDFVSANAAPADRHAAARQYLTDEAAAEWDDSSRTTVLTGVDTQISRRGADVVEVTLSGDVAGLLGVNGDFELPQPTSMQSAPGAGVPYEATTTLVQVDGEWRISDLPDGAVMDQSSFRAAYQRQPVYFLAPGLGAVVPDLRWVVNDPESVPAQLVNLLVSGPSPNLAPGVTSYLGGDVQLRSNITTVDGQGPPRVGGAGGVRIDFEGLGELDAPARALLAAQVVWTLDAARVNGPFVLLADGVPLDPARPNGWSTTDVAATDPASAPGAALGLYAVLGGALQSVDEDQVSPVPGALGGETRLSEAGISRDGEVVAGVLTVPGGGQRLVVGTLNGAVTEVLSADTLTRPTFGADDRSVWVVQDGTTVLLGGVSSDTGAPRPLQQVDTTGLGALSAPITELRLSRDGVRAALVVGGAVLLTVVTRTDSGVVALSRAERVAPSLSPLVRSVDWVGADTLVVARNEQDRPVVTVSIDGSQVAELPGTNLTAPVRSVSASATRTFVADGLGVLGLGTEQSTGESEWIRVDGLSGTAGASAVPLLPG